MHEWMLPIGTDGDILVLFLILKLIRMSSSKVQSQGTDHKQPTMFYNLLSFYCISIRSTAGGIYVAMSCWAEVQTLPVLYDSMLV